MQELNLAIESCGLKVLGSKQVKSDDHYFYEITLAGRKAEHTPLLEKLLKSPRVQEIKY